MSSDVVVLTFFTNLICLYCSFINYKRDVKFMNKFIFTLSNEEMTKINVVDLEKLYKFVIENFFI